MQLERQRERTQKTVTLEELMCPIKADLITSQKESIEPFEVKETKRTCIQSFEVNKVEDDSDSDYIDDEVTFHGDGSNMQFRHRERIMSVEDWAKYDAVDKIRLLMWNPENLAQRLNFDSTTTRGKQNRTNSPPLKECPEGMDRTNSGGQAKLHHL